MKFVFKSKNMLSSSPSIAQYKAPRKRKRKKRTFDVKACLFLIPVMLGTIVLLYSVRNTLHVSNRLFIKSFIFKIREQFSKQKSYYLYPGENEYDDLEEYFLEEDDEDFDNDDDNDDLESEDDSDNIYVEKKSNTNSRTKRKRRNNNKMTTKDDENAYNELDASAQTNNVDNEEEEPESRETALKKLMGFFGRGQDFIECWVHVRLETDRI